MQTPSFCHRTALVAAAVLLLCWGAPRAVAQAGCTPVSTRIVGVNATNCVLLSPAQQAGQPVCEVVADGFPTAYWLITLTNQPAGYVLTNGSYPGWCADYDVVIESGIEYKPVAYLSTQPLPPHLTDPNWNRINYILNHKQGTAFDVQGAIWRFIGGPVAPFDPVFGTLTTAGSNMVAAATAHGASFIPGPGQVSAVILDVGPTNQLHFIEVACPAVVQACPGSSLTLCTTNTGTGPFTYAWYRNLTPIPGATNACLSLNNLSIADAGTLSVRVSNACGTATNSFTLHVSNASDPIPPVLTCSPGRTFQCPSQLPPAPELAAVSASDNAGPVQISLASETRLTNGCEIQVTRRYQATDACGNTAFCERTDLIRDTLPPTLTCLSNRTVECTAPWDFNPPSATDNCSGTNVSFTILSTITNANPACPGTFSATRTWRATDACGNAATCSQTISVLDTTPPVITCASNAVEDCGTLWSFTEPSATDACHGASVTLSLLSTVTNAGPCAGSLVVTRTWQASDPCGNTATCSQTISVLDTTPPILTCAPDATVPCATPWSFTPPTAANPAARARPAFFQPAAGPPLPTTTCGDTNITLTILSTTTNAGPCGTTYSATRTWQATDACGNSTTCSQTITVVDTIPPVITCASNRVVECSASWAFNPPITSDLCSGTNVALIVLSTTTNTGPCLTTYDVTRTWRATDPCGNASTCSQTITVIDTLAPVLTCASNRVVECSASWVFNPPIASDLCDGTNVALTILSTVTNTGPCGTTYSATRSWRATDACGNASTCSQTITVVDTTPPVLTCASNRVVECSQPWSFSAPIA
ncbi:MAG: hypothetical protein RJA22_2810, partial [Verrucomicrobiota bacterium]